MLPLGHPDRIQFAFDDHRLVANAGLILRVTLPQPWVCVNSSTTTLTSELRRAGRTRATRL